MVANLKAGALDMVTEKVLPTNISLDLRDEWQRTGEGRVIRGQLQQVVDRYVSNVLPEPLKLEFVGEVPLDTAVREAIRKRQLLMECVPGCAASQALASIAAKIAE